MASMTTFIKFFATVFGVGYSPVAPGTVGTIVGVGFYYIMRNMPLPHYIIFVLVFIFMASWVSDIAEEIFTEEDPQKVVIDEVAGFLVTMIGFQFNWILVVAGFILFRTFDIIKPFPIRQLERKITGGFGIVLDDVLAGIYANISLRILIWVLAQAPFNISLIKGAL